MTNEIPDTLYNRLSAHCSNYKRNKSKSAEEFVHHVLHLAVLLPDEPGYGELGAFDTWETMFAKSITHYVRF